jgi:hypothetical protein
LVDEACANVRVQLDSQPEEINRLVRKRIELQVHLHALGKETDKQRKAQLVEVGDDSPGPELLIHLTTYLVMQHTTFFSIQCNPLRFRSGKNWTI